MTLLALSFSYTEGDPSLGTASALPYLPLTVEHKGKTASVSALLDSGAALNVLPYEVGLQLGAVWEQQTIPVRLTGNLAESEARAILLTGTVGHFPPVGLAFAWTRNRAVPMILGQVNFFMEFDVCFFRSRKSFEVKPKETPGH